VSCHAVGRIPCACACAAASMERPASGQALGTRARSTRPASRANPGTAPRTAREASGTRARSTRPASRAGPGTAPRTARGTRAACAARAARSAPSGAGAPAFVRRIGIVGYRARGEVVVWHREGVILVHDRRRAGRVAARAAAGAAEAA
jgi:hypothetical protein